MTLLTFLGTADYKQTTYILDGQRHTSKYCPAAVAHFHRPDTTLVVVTQKAKEMHFEALADEIANITRPIPVPIPNGKSEDELWQIFNALTKYVSEGDDLIVDITNGFRSLPFLSFLAIAFLRLARRVRVQRILYGAWEARNDSNESPIFDLTPFLTLLDWTIAADRFTRFSDASDLASLLREGVPPGPVMGKDLQAREVGNALKAAAGAMETVSLAMRLTRPLEVMTAAAKLTRTLEQVNPLVKRSAPPFAALAEQVRQAYAPLALSDKPLNETNLEDNLRIQFDLIGRYLEQGQIVQAMTLAREWLVSLLVVHFNVGPLTDHKATREPIEFALSNMAAKSKGKVPRHTTPFDTLLQQLSVSKELGKLWDEMTQIRNDIAHVGMNLTPCPAHRLRQRAEDILPRLQTAWATLQSTTSS